MPNANVLYLARFRPDETAAIGASRTARSARPKEPRSNSHAPRNITAATAQTRYEFHAFVVTPPIGDESKLTCSPPPPPVKPSKRFATSVIEIASPKVASAR